MPTSPINVDETGATLVFGVDLPIDGNITITGQTCSGAFSAGAGGPSADQTAFLLGAGGDGTTNDSGLAGSIGGVSINGDDPLTPGTHVVALDGGEEIYMVAGGGHGKTAGGGSGQFLDLSNGSTGDVTFVVGGAGANTTATFDGETITAHAGGAASGSTPGSGGTGSAGTITGWSAIGSSDGNDGTAGANGGGYGTFNGSISVSQLIDGVSPGDVSLLCSTGAAGSEAICIIQVAGGPQDASEFDFSVATNGNNGGTGAVLDQDNLNWIASHTDGEDAAVANSGTDGSMSFSWGSVVTDWPPDSWPQGTWPESDYPDPAGHGTPVG